MTTTLKVQHHNNLPCIYPMQLHGSHGAHLHKDKGMIANIAKNFQFFMTSDDNFITKLYAVTIPIRPCVVNT